MSDYQRVYQYVYYFYTKIVLDGNKAGTDATKVLESLQGMGSEMWTPTQGKEKSPKQEI